MFLTRLTVISIVQLLLFNRSWVICNECNDGDYVSDPNDCNGFLQCRFGNWFQRNCATGLHFNPINLACDFPWNTNCQIVTTTTADPIAPTTTTTASPSVPPTAPTAPPTHLPTETPIPTQAPTTTTLSTTITTTFAPTSTTTRPPIPDLDCSVISPYVVHLPHPNCSMFYKCVHGIPHEMECPLAQHWSISLDRCESPTDADCMDGEAREQTNARPPNYW